MADPVCIDGQDTGAGIAPELSDKGRSRGDIILDMITVDREPVALEGAPWRASVEGTSPGCRHRRIALDADNGHVEAEDVIDIVARVHVRNEHIRNRIVRDEHGLNRIIQGRVEVGPLRPCGFGYGPVPGLISEYIRHAVAGKVAKAEAAQRKAGAAYVGPSAGFG